MSVKVVLIGARGYATSHLHPLLENMHTGKYTIAGVIARDITKSEYCEWVQKENITVCKSLEEYFESGYKADLVVISTPPQLHRKDTLLAIENGADVLCEKPVASSYEDAKMMLEASEKSGKFVGICYQWSYSAANRAFKSDILAGKLGKPKELKVLVSWPRGWSYYDGWKGRIKDDEGNLILDSVVCNAAAHYLHNMYYILGDAMDESDAPDKIRSELIRVNNIENFDTCFLDIKTKSGAKLTYIASHAAEKADGPRFVFNFENAVVTFNMGGEANHIIATFTDGTVKDYGDPGEMYNQRLWDSIDSVTTREPLVCTVKTAIAHTYTINQLYEKAQITDAPKELLCIDENEEKTYLKGLYEFMLEAYEKGCLLSDLGVDWIKADSFTV